MRNYRTWLRTAAIFQFITAVMHAISLFDKPLPKNETEKQLFELMSNYQFDFGAGFHRTLNEVTFPLEICFSLFCLFGGLINWFLLGKRADIQIMRGIVIINLIVFGICFGFFVIYTFLPPIILTGLIFTFLLLSLFKLEKEIITSNPKNN